MAGEDRKVWRHQALMLEQIDAGNNAVVATGTASGKSLTYCAPIARELLEAEGTAIYFSPTKALASDQLRRCQAVLEAVGLSPDFVGEITGGTEMRERDRILDTARWLLVTPDVIHAWMMPNTAAPAVQKFLARLRFVVIDEAHAMEAVFGSNCAYFFRRLICAAERARAALRSSPGSLQFIAATATIAQPAHHLERLTGRPFSVVSEQDNGAPFHKFDLLHIEGPAHGAAAEKMVSDIATNLAGTIAPAAFIAFVDGRQSAERIALAAEGEVCCCRAGFDTEDRQAIETSLRDGTLRGIIATSVLELGIDIPHFTVGLNLGVPPSNKNILQRLGRTGRASEGVFALIAPPNAFTETGGSFREFVEGPVDPTPLYLENPYIQFQQASCLLAEIGIEDGAAKLPSTVEWPAGFEKAFAMAQPGARRPAELERIAVLSTGNPHRDYSLRQIMDVEYGIRTSSTDGAAVGTIDIDKAMREAFPGATYIHCGQPYQVVEWRTTNYERSIIVRPVRHGGRTKPMMRSVVTITHDPAEVINDHLLTGERGSLAEINLRVTESVEGYCLGKNEFFYRDLSQSDRRKSRKQREFNTTGITIEIDEPWFSGRSEGATAVRRMVAKGLVAVLARDKSIAPSEIRSAHTSIAKLGGAAPRRLENAIVIFDNVLGGLRLTESLFSQFDRALDLLKRGVDLAGADALVDMVTIDRLDSWYRSLTPPGEYTWAPPVDLMDGERLIFAPESKVGIRQNGTLHERRLMSHELVAVGDIQQLMYRYETRPGVLGLVPHDQIEPIGHDWRQMLWHPGTNTTRELEASARAG